MVRVKVSSKRQVTFPRRVCESLGLETGDEIVLEPRMEAGREVWELRPAKANTRPWLGALKEFGTGKKHGINAVRESIARGRQADPT